MHSKPTALMFMCLILLVLLIPLSMDLYIPALKQVQMEFGSSTPLTQMTMSVFLIFFAVGQLLFGLLAEHVRWYRGIFVGLSVFTVGTLSCLFASHVYGFMLGRVLQAFGVSACLVFAYAWVQRYTRGKQLIRSLTLISFILAVAPMFAPLLGGYLAKLYGWQSNFDVLLGCSLLLFIVFLIQSRFLHSHAYQHPLLPKRNFTQGFKRMLNNPSFIGFAVSMGLCYGVIFLYLVEAPFLFDTHYHFTEWRIGEILVVNAVAYIIGSAIANFALPRWSPAVIARISIMLALGVACILSLWDLYFPMMYTPLIIFMFFITVNMATAIPALMRAAVQSFAAMPTLAGSVASSLQFFAAGVACILVTFFKRNAVLDLALSMMMALIIAWVVMELFSLEHKVHSSISIDNS